MVDNNKKIQVKCKRLQHRQKVLKTQLKSRYTLGNRNYRSTFRAMDKLSKSKIIERATKVKIFKSSVKTLLLYASEWWRVTQRTIDRL